ncbi:MAG: hypothetical protein WCC53_12595 [Thermoanaerobaculia bacterium]|jgi:hypothetical protein
MNELLLFGSSVALSLAAWAGICRLYLWPRVSGLPLPQAARPILFLHVFRFVGAAFLIPGVAGPTLPSGFSAPAATGDLGAVVLAWAALGAARGPAARPLLWVFNLWGTADLLFAFYQGLAGVGIRPSSLGATYFIPTVFVPLLLCTHVVLFVLLLRRDAALTHP